MPLLSVLHLAIPLPILLVRLRFQLVCIQVQLMFLDMVHFHLSCTVGSKFVK